jgi:S-adenosylmethionine/arginine decarboxylase-like enzyme
MIGLHLMLDGVMRLPVSGELVDSILRELPGMIGMKIIAGPVVVEGNPSNPGWTGFVIIDKSHIAIHTFTEGNRISMDVFSCQSFDADEVERYLLAKISLTRVDKHFLTRSEA